MYLNAGKLKKILSQVDDRAYVAVGTKENNEIDEIRNESGIVDVRLKNIGFDSSNEQYVKIYINNYSSDGCLRFTR